jgi:regulatory protein
MNNAPDNPEKLQHYLMGLLARREYSAHELRTKCRNKGFEDPDIDPILEKFKANKWQSDERFAEMFTRSRVNRGYGPLRIQRDLRLKGISEQLVEQCLAEVSDWSVLALAVWQKKFNQAAIDDKAKAKQFRYLAQRGFYQQDIYPIINKPSSKLNYD